MNAPLESFFTHNDGAQAEQYRDDMNAMEREAREALEAARARALTDQEISAIAFWARLDLRKPRPAPKPASNGEPF